MIWMGNDLSLINDWESYLKGIHLQHGMGSLLRWTGALQRTHVLPAASARPDASLRERVWDVAVVPESIPLSPLLPPGNEMRSDVDSSPPPVSLYISVALCLYVSLLLSISSFCHPFLLFLKKKKIYFSGLECFPHYPVGLCDAWLQNPSSELRVCAEEHESVSIIECWCQIWGYIFNVLICTVVSDLLLDCHIVANMLACFPWDTCDVSIDVICLFMPSLQFF